MDCVRTGRKRPAHLGLVSKGRRGAGGWRERSAAGQARCMFRDADKDTICVVLNSITAGQRAGGEKGRSINRLRPVNRLQQQTACVSKRAWKRGIQLTVRVEQPTAGHQGTLLLQERSRLRLGTNSETANTSSSRPVRLSQNQPRLAFSHPFI